MQMWLKVVHNGLLQLSRIWMALICISFWFASFLGKCVLLNDRAHPAPPRHCLYTLFIYFLIVIWTQQIYSCHSLSLYVRHIRHSSMAEFDSITAQTSSHYLSAEYSLNVNVFLGRLHQCEILKNIPLIDNVNHRDCVPSPLNTSFTTSVAMWWGTVYMQSPALMRSGCGVGLVIRRALARIRTLVIGLIRANSCVGHAYVMACINTPQNDEVQHPAQR